MSDQETRGRGPRGADGFATLTADLLERRTRPAPPDAPGPNARPEPPRTLRTRSDESLQAPEKSSSQAENAPRRFFGLARRPAAASSETAVEDRKFYTDEERRQRDVSPVVERRRTVPPRIKVSLRLESHRHKRLKNASVLLNRTHQDLLTAALDRYLDALGIAPGKKPRQDC